MRNSEANCEIDPLRESSLQQPLRLESTLEDLPHDGLLPQGIGLHVLSGLAAGGGGLTLDCGVFLAVFGVLLVPRGWAQMVSQGSTE